MFFELVPKTELELSKKKIFYDFDNLRKIRKFILNFQSAAIFSIFNFFIPF